MAKKAARKAAKPAAKKKARQALKTSAAKAAKKLAVKKFSPRRAMKKAASAAAAVKDGRAPGYPQLTLSLVVRSMHDSLRFYEQAFGFKPEMSMPGPDGQMIHAQMSYFGGRIMFGPEGAMGGTNRAPVTTATEASAQAYVYCPDVDALLTQARAAGAKVLMGPENMFWGDRIVHLEDPDGYRWAFATNIGPMAAGGDPRH